MTKEEQRKAIAEACGIFICDGCNHVIDPDCCGCGDSIKHYPDGHSPVPMGCQCGYDDAPKRKLASPDCPNYPEDLNAMHLAWCQLNKEQHRVFRIYLQQAVVRDGWICGPCQSVCNATASQRAEAFLKTMGKWKD